MTDAEEVLDALTELRPGDAAIYTDHRGEHKCIIAWVSRAYVRIFFHAPGATFAVVKPGTVRRDTR